MASSPFTRDMVLCLREEANWRRRHAERDPEYARAHIERADLLGEIANRVETLLADGEETADGQ